jgi:hypothetical protein
MRTDRPRHISEDAFEVGFEVVAAVVANIFQCYACFPSSRTVAENTKKKELKQKHKKQSSEVLVYKGRLK